jgi:purine-binding chemotaxis protein CheW
MKDDKAELLRRDFDQAFAAPARRAQAGTEALLAIRVAGEGFALRLSALAGLFADRRIVPLPGTAPELLGIAGLRGGLVAVYDLRALLGFPRGESPRWLALVRGGNLLGIAFDELDGSLQVDPHDVSPATGPAHRGMAREVVRTGGVLRPVLDVASIVETIRRPARHGVRPEER